MRSFRKFVSSTTEKFTDDPHFWMALMNEIHSKVNE